jgi:hypothetical protein
MNYKYYTTTKAIVATTTITSVTDYGHTVCSYLVSFAGSLLMTPLEYSRRATRKTKKFNGLRCWHYSYDNSVKPTTYEYDT